MEGDGGIEERIRLVGKVIRYISGLVRKEKKILLCSLVYFIRKENFFKALFSFSIIFLYVLLESRQ